MLLFFLIFFYVSVVFFTCYVCVRYRANNERRTGSKFYI